MPFQTSVLADPAPGLEGGFASINAHFSMLNPNNGDSAISAYSSWKVGPNGAIVGRFGFAEMLTGLVSNVHFGTATTRVGFVHRFQPVIIPNYLGQSYSGLYGGQEIDICDGGDFWVKFAAGATPGQKVFASYADGSAVAGTAGSTINATAFNVTTTNGSPNLTAVAGTLYPGQPISGTGIPAGAYIVSVGTGTAVMSANATASGTVSATPVSAVETRWWVDSLSPAGGISKISTRG